MLRARLLATLVLAAPALLASGRAAACSCVEPHLERRVVPEDGATDFPTDGIVRVFLDGFPESTRGSVGSEYRLRDPSGALVPLVVGATRSRLDLRPRAPLTPGTSYVLEQVFAFDASGTRLTDLQRLSASSLRGIWYPVATFRTGVGPAAVRAVAPSIASARLHFAHGGGDCGPATAVAVEIAMPPGARPTDVVELRVRSQGAVTTDLASASSLYAGDMLCDPEPVTLASGSSLEVQVVAIDAAGHELGTSTWVRAQGVGTRSPSSRASGLLGAPAWPAASIVPAPPSASSRGPSACPDGLEVVSRHDAGEHGPWAYGDRTTLSADGGARWMATAGDDGAPFGLYAVAGDGAASRVTTTVSGYPSGLCATPSGPLVSTTTYTQDAHARGHLIRLDGHGAPSWTVDLTGDGSDHRIARGGGRVLVAWASRAPDYAESLAYAIVDEASGAIIASASPTAFGLDSNSEGPAAAFVDGRFLIAWGTGSGFRRGPFASVVVSGTTLGTPNDLSTIDSYSPPDLVGAGTRAGLATATSGGLVQLTILDRDGAIDAGPFDLSTGIGGGENRLPRIAWNGTYFLVGWETYPSPGVYVVAADATGAVSPALRVDASEPYAGTIGMVATTSGWLAGYTTDRAHARIAELRCRASAPLGPPQSIPPAP